MEKHSVARLVGAPPGYIGYEEGGQLTEAVRRRSYSVILLDEIEKAHPEVFNMLLQIMEDGQLTDAKGRRVDFRNTIIIMTSNVGAELLKRDHSLGFGITQDSEKAEKSSYDKMKDKVLGELKNTFRPEFLNRIDGVMVFHSLTQEQIRAIVDLMLKRVRQQLTEQRIKLEVTDAAKDHLVSKGYDPAFGARPLRRVIQNMVEDELADGLLQGRFKAEDTVTVDYVDGELKMEARQLVGAQQQR
jgi:ATP-dependent Clp protease ATP-binding subunit ClpC